MLSLDLRRMYAADIRARKANRRQREHDDFIRSRCPHLFHDWRTQLRRWYKLMRGDEYGKGTWGYAFRQLEEASGKDAGTSPTMMALAEASAEFRDRRAPGSLLTHDEIEFILYWAWRFQGKPNDGVVDRIVVVPDFKKFLDEQMRRYGSGERQLDF